MTSTLPTVPTVNLTPMTPTQLLASVKHAAKPFAKTSAATVTEAPKAPSVFCRAADLYGVRFYVLTGSRSVWNYEGKSGPQVTYEIIIESRSDLGIRKLSLRSQWALAQFDELTNKAYPFLATIAKGNPEKGAFASNILGNAPNKDTQQYQTPEEIAEMDALAYGPDIIDVDKIPDGGNSNE